MRELVLVRWIQESYGYPFVATADVDVRPVFEALAGANERYYRSALQHLEAYGMDKKRGTILERIKEHNSEVRNVEYNGGRSPLINSGNNLPRRMKLGQEQNEIWASVQLLREELQGVVNDLEEGHLKGLCDYEKKRTPRGRL